MGQRQASAGVSSQASNYDPLAGCGLCPRIMCGVDGPESLPDSTVALEAGAKGQLPQLLALLHTLQRLHVRPGIPAGC